MNNALPKQSHCNITRNSIIELRIIDPTLTSITRENKTFKFIYVRHVLIPKQALALTRDARNSVQFYVGAASFWSVAKARNLQSRAYQVIPKHLTFQAGDGVARLAKLISR